MWSLDSPGVGWCLVALSGWDMRPSLRAHLPILKSTAGLPHLPATPAILSQRERGCCAPAYTPRVVVMFMRNKKRPWDGNPRAAENHVLARWSEVEGQ